MSSSVSLIPIYLHQLPVNLYALLQLICAKFSATITWKSNPAVLILMEHPMKLFGALSVQSCIIDNVHYSQSDIRLHIFAI